MSNPLADSPSGSTVQQPPLHVLRWHDPLIDRLGHDPRSRYVERFWLGILGPSTTLVLRVLADALDEHGGVAHLDLPDIAAQIGVGHRGGRNSPLSRSIQRAIRLGQPDPPAPTRSRSAIVSLPSTAARSSAYRSPSRLSINTSTSSRSLLVPLVRGHAASR